VDLVLRAIFGFFLVFLVTRVAGRRELSSLEPFDLILLIVLGDLLQQGITQDDYSVTGMLLVIVTMTLLTVAVSYASFRMPRVGRVLQGEPTVLIERGELIGPNLRRERITPRELAAEARLQGIASLGDVRWAVLETNGRISFLKEET
jgi:uncharacterized membrane protein YcaP (DUF421 family)